MKNSGNLPPKQSPSVTMGMLYECHVHNVHDTTYIYVDTV